MKQNGKPRRENNREVTLDDAAYHLGQEAFGDLQERAGQLVSWERARCGLQNQPDIISVKARLGCRNERREELKEALRLAPPDDLSSLRRRRLFYRSIALVLVASSIFFAHIAILPFGLGWDAWVFCLGIGLIAAFWTDQTLEKTQSEWLIRGLCFVALATSLAGLLIMALLRGNILALYLDAASSGSAIGDPQNAGRVTTFYTHAIPLLQMFMALLAIGMELGSGMAVFEARKFDLTSHERAARARCELKEVEDEMAAMLGHLTHLENGPAMNEASFYRNFYLGLFERAKRNSLLLIFLSVSSLVGFAVMPSAHAQILPQTPSQAYAASHRARVVIELDRTLSVAAQGYDGESEYEKDVRGICAAIAHAPAGSRITVVGITDQSFSRPDILLNAEIPINKGPLLFQNQIAIAKARLANKFKRVSTGNKPRFPQTDIFGSIVLAGGMFRETGGGRKVLVIFSDMRNSADGINIERPLLVPVQEALQRAESQDLVAPLEGVDVYVLGVDGEGKSVEYWQSLKRFWEAYFRKAGAVLKEYSALRPVPASFGQR